MTHSGTGQIQFMPAEGPTSKAVDVGFRFGDKGTHTSRTLMSSELAMALEAVPADAEREAYAAAIIDDNCLGKVTEATRRLSNQRLGELYALDRSVLLFRVLRKLWAFDEEGRPLLALLSGLARDPLLRATADPIVRLAPGSEMQRDELKLALRGAVGDRLNDSTLGKVVRNCASSWTQAGHLEGRTFKRRRKVRPTPAVVAFAIFLARSAGFVGEELLQSAWTTCLDCGFSDTRDLVLESKRLGLLDVRIASDVFEVNLERLDPALGRR